MNANANSKCYAGRLTTLLIGMASTASFVAAAQKKLRAIGASRPTATRPTPIEKLLASHPIGKPFLTTQKPVPVSYATRAYFGVHSFKFTDASNSSVHVRDRFIPKASEQFLEPATVKAKGPNYLVGEVATRATATPIVFDWFAQVSRHGDAIADPCIAIEVADPMLALRNAAYPSFLAHDRNARRLGWFDPPSMLHRPSRNVSSTMRAIFVADTGVARKTPAQY